MSFRAAAQRRRRPQAAIATGGVGSTLAVNGRFYRILTFTASGMLTLVQGGRIEYLILGGGGGGAGSSGNESGGAGLSDSHILVDFLAHSPCELSTVLDGLEIGPA